MKLSGKAYNLTRHRTRDKWDDLKNLLIEIFSEKRSQGPWELELHRCRQGKDEPVIEFAGCLENILIKLIDSVTVGSTKEAAIERENLMQAQGKNVFLIGLRDPINILVKSRNPDSFKKAIELAVVEERELLSKQDSEKLMSNKETCQLCGKINHIAKNCFKFNKRVLSFDSSEKVCTNCKKKGHLVDTCWFLKVRFAAVKIIDF